MVYKSIIEMEDMDIKVTENNIHIKDSYKISKKYFESILKEIKKNYPNCNVWERSFCSLKQEWSAHNFLYLLNYKRERVKDVDLNVPIKWYVKIRYFIVGIIGWIFIK